MNLIRYTFPLLGILLMVNCTTKKTNPSDDIELNSKLIAGEWRLDSTSNNYNKNQRLIFDENGDFHEFSISNGGGLIDYGKIIDSDSLIDKHNNKYKVSIIDSNYISIKSNFNNSFSNNYTHYYKRSKYGDYNEKLIEYLKSDSLRRRAIGWWKLTATKLPVKLVNYSGKYEQFILHIKDDGSATYYLNNYLDSLVNYGYRIRKNRIEFSKGCIVDSGPEIIIKRRKMKMIQGRHILDTIELTRILKID
ncbi:hypothetical protein V2647_04295 [Tenacibaculum maritimum]|uniref:hypothetical protein n=1 Tax=Tenacibaculum maritimum TaxID=107401 RepID=UPI0012E6AC55|nr:hypothetical protein [Tenacibaculum maritimum]CAA0155144.1 conserved hypothetical protein [Tenacibaculum maritimum]